jgi:hypothetical protein
VLFGKETPDGGRCAHDVRLELATIIDHGQRQGKGEFISATEFSPKERRIKSSNALLGLVLPRESSLSPSVRKAKPYDPGVPSLIPS